MCFDLLIELVKLLDALCKFLRIDLPSEKGQIGLACPKVCVSLKHPVDEVGLIQVVLGIVAMLSAQML